VNTTIRSLVDPGGWKAKSVAVAAGVDLVVTGVVVVGAIVVVDVAGAVSSDPQATVSALMTPTRAIDIANVVGRRVPGRRSTPEIVAGSVRRL